MLNGTMVNDLAPDSSFGFGPGDPGDNGGMGFGGPGLNDGAGTPSAPIHYQ